MRFFTINPVDNKVVKKFGEMRESAVEECIKNATQEFELWKSTPVATRCRYLKAVTDVLLAERKRFADLITLEVGKPTKEAMAETEKCAMVSEFYSEKAIQWLEEEKIET